MNLCKPRVSERERERERERGRYDVSVKSALNNCRARNTAAASSNDTSGCR